MLMLIERKSNHVVHQVLDFLEFDVKYDETRLPVTGVASPKGQSLCRKRPKKQCVRFDTLLNVYHETGHFSQEEMRNCWFSPKELKAFRSNLVDEVKKLKLQASKPELSFLKIVKELFTEQCNSARRRSFEVSKFLDHSHNAQLSLCERKYVQLLTNKPELLGMERLALEATFKKDKVTLRRQQLAMMLEFNRITVAGTTPQNKEEFIRLTCDSATRPYRTLASRIAYIQMMQVST